MENDRSEKRMRANEKLDFFFFAGEGGGAWASIYEELSVCQNCADCLGYAKTHKTHSLKNDKPPGEADTLTVNHTGE